jgi:hypothetical protein
VAIAHRATSSATATADTDDGASPAVPTGTTDGDVLLAWVSTANDKTITPPSGWTQMAELSANGNTIWLGYKVAASESGTYAFTWTDSKATAIVSAYSGVDNTKPIVYWLPTNTGTGTSQTVAAMSGIGTDPTNSMLVTFMSLNRGATTTTQPTGYTLPTNGNPDSGGTTATSVESGVAYKSYTGGSGIASTNWTTTNGALYTTAHIALRESGSTQDIVCAWPGVTTTSASSSSLALTMPYNHVSGDLLICPVTWRGDSVSASMSGWTQKGSTVTEVGGIADVNMAIFYKYATSSSESGTVALSPATADDIVANVFIVKRLGTGDPFGDYQTVLDATSNTSSDFPALTVTAQEMVLLAMASRRGDQTVTTEPSGMVPWGSPFSTTPRYIRSGSAADNLTLGLGLLYQSTANPAGGTFTYSGSSTSVGAQGALAIGSASSPRFRAYIIG